MNDHSQLQRKDSGISYKGFLTSADVEYDERVRRALGLPSRNHSPLREKMPPAGGAAKKSKPSFVKIQSALTEEESQGGRIYGLRPGERFRRIAERLKLMGYKESE